MTRRLYLHVGAPKSGTTYLQSVLRHNRARLRDAGVLVAGRRHVEAVRAGLVVREDPRVRNLSPYDAASWDRIVAEIRSWSGDVAILSYELLSAATAKQARAALARFEGIEVHVVFSARDFGRALPSAWQERIKFALTTPLESWVPRREDDPRAEWGWRTMDPTGVLSRWGDGLDPARVHLVTVPPRGSEPTELWTRFARACGLDGMPLDLGVTTANESLDPATAELLRRVNAYVGAPIVGNREHARWIRDTLAHRVLVPRGGKEGLGMTDLQFEEARTRSAAAIEALRSRGYDVHGDLEDIRATRPTGRTPGEVDDAELVEVAAQAIADLLVLLREATLSGPTSGDDEDAEPGDGLTTRARTAARRAAEETGAAYLRRRTDQMAGEIERLEAEVRSGRVLQRRVSELEDVVMELLLPAEDQDDEQLLAAIKRYRRESL